MNNRYSWVLAASTLIASLSGCGKNCTAHYDFKVPVELSSYDSIQTLGDTLSVSIFIDNTRLEDSFVDREVSIPNFDPRLTLAIVDLDSLEYDYFIEEAFEIIVEEPYTVANNKTDERPTRIIFNDMMITPDSTKMEFSLVLNRRAEYALVFTSLIVLQSRHIKFEGRCGTDGKITATARFNGEQRMNEEPLYYEEKHMETMHGYFGYEGSPAQGIGSTFYFKVE